MRVMIFSIQQLKLGIHSHVCWTWNFFWMDQSRPITWAIKIVSPTTTRLIGRDLRHGEQVRHDYM